MSMNLQYIFGNPIAKDQKKGKLRKKETLMQRKRKSKASHEAAPKRRRHHRKHRKNPALEITHNKKLITKTYYPSGRQVHAARSLIKRLVKSAAGKSVEERKRIAHQIARAKQTLSQLESASKIAQDRVALVKKKGKGWKVKKVKTRLDRAKLTKENILAGFSPEEIKELQKEVRSHGRKKKGVKGMAKKRKARKAKRHGKRKHHAKKRYHAKKRHHKHHPKRRHHARKRKGSHRRHRKGYVKHVHRGKKHRHTHHTAARALNIMEKLAELKKGKTMKIRRRKYKRINPISVESIEKAMGMNTAEIGGMFAGGALVPVLDALLTSTLPKIPAIGSSLSSLKTMIPGNSALLPLVIGALGNHFSKNEQVRNISKGVVGAAVAYLGYDIAKYAVGIAGISVPGLAGTAYTPVRLGEVSATPAGPADSVDFGAAMGYRYDYHDNLADFDGVPRGMAGMGDVDVRPNSHADFDNLGHVPAGLAAVPAGLRGVPRGLAGGKYSDGRTGHTYEQDGDYLDENDAQLG